MKTQKILKSAVSLMLVFVLMVGIIPNFGTKAEAATTINAFTKISSRGYAKTYTLSSSGRTIPYTTKYLSTRGTVSYGASSSSYIDNNTDELYVYEVGTTSGKSWALVSYPTGRGRVKAYIHLSAITKSANSSSHTYYGKATEKFLCAYRYGLSTNKSYYVDKGDDIYVLKISSILGVGVQIMYPAGSVWRIGWCKYSDIQKYLSNSSTGTKNVAEGVYIIRSALNTKKVVDVYGANMVNGNNVNLYDSNSSIAQKFYLKYVSNGYYAILVDSNRNMALDVHGGTGYSGANVEIFSYHGGNNQLWKFVKAGSYYYIVSKSGNFYLDVSGGNTANCTNIQVYTGNQTAAQKWKLSKTTSASVQTYTGYVNTSSSNLMLRSGPSTGYSVVASMPKGSQVTVLDNKATTNGFYHVTYGSNTGYASASYITFTKPQQASDSYSINNNILTLKGVSMTEYPIGSTFENVNYANVNGSRVWTGAKQCYGYACYIEHKLYGHCYHTARDRFPNLNGSRYVKPNATELKRLIQLAGVGAHIRTQSGHSMILIGYTDAGFTITDANAENTNRVDIRTYTWSSYLNTSWGKSGFDFIEIHS